MQSPAAGTYRAPAVPVMWQTEQDLVRACAPSLQAMAAAARETCKTLLLGDQRTGYGRPDLLVVQARTHVLAQRAMQSDRSVPFDRRAAYAMAFLARRRWTSLQTLAAFLRLSPTRVEDLAKSLEARALVLRRGYCLRARPLSEALAIQRVLAYEAKLRAWQRALVQACRHLWFAQESYVLLGSSSPSTAVDAAAQCRTYGVGLILPDADGRPRVVVPSNLAPLRPTYFLWLLNEAFIDEHGAPRLLDA